MQVAKWILGGFVPVLTGLILLVGFVASVARFDPDVAGLNENRRKNPLPEWKGQELGVVMDQTDNYFSDNYGFRDALICANSLIQNLVLQANSSENIFLDRFGLNCS